MKPPLTLKTCFNYVTQKLQFSAVLSHSAYKSGQISHDAFRASFLKNLFQSKMTYLYPYKVEDTHPTSRLEGTLLVRELPEVNLTRVFVGDVVIVEDPDNKENFLIRRLAAIEGDEIASKDEKEEPFFLDEDHCWLSSDNVILTPMEARDSRTFGPVPIDNILGRVLYFLRSAVDHGPVDNSHTSTQNDFSVLAAELDVTEMTICQKAENMMNGVIIETVEPGIYATLTQLKDGTKVFERVGFSKQFSVEEAEEWWRINESKVLQKYNQHGSQPKPSADVAPTPVVKADATSASEPLTSVAPTPVVIENATSASKPSASVAPTPFMKEDATLTSGPLADVAPTTLVMKEDATSASEPSATVTPPIVKEDAISTSEPSAQ